jgi:cytochrome c oxidase cbb3-type subunit 4
MDVNTLRALVTVVSFAIFIAIVGWAWSRRRRQASTGKRL